jgi:peroxiredoxin
MLPLLALRKCGASPGSGKMPDKRFPLRCTTSLRKLAVLLLVPAWATSAIAVPPAFAQRKSPDFTIVQPSGAQTLLSSFDGKVVVLEFLFVRSPHCLRVAQTLNKLQQELGPRGFQSVGIAFGPDASGWVVADLVRYFKLSYPMGYSTAGDVDAYLGRGEKEILKIPQIVVIDRLGIIRAASGTRGEPNLENESSLRNLLDTLLKEPAPKGTAKNARFSPK